MTENTKNFEESGNQAGAHCKSLEDISAVTLYIEMELTAQNETNGGKLAKWSKIIKRCLTIGGI